MLLRKVGSSVVTALQQQDAANNGPFVNSKGRSNFGKPIGAPNDLITLADSNFLKTIATAGQHPSNDAGDIAIGVPDFVDAAIHKALAKKPENRYASCRVMASALRQGAAQKGVTLVSVATVLNKRDPRPAGGPSKEVARAYFINSVSR